MAPFKRLQTKKHDGKQLQIATSINKHTCFIKNAMNIMVLQITSNLYQKSIGITNFVELKPQHTTHNKHNGIL